MSLPRHVVNFDELTDDIKTMLLRLIQNEMGTKLPELNADDLEALLEKIKSLLPYEHYKRIKVKVEMFVYESIEGVQKSEGKLLDIPPLIKKNIETFEFNKEVYLTGLHIDQTGWKKNDRYTLEVGKNKIIDNATTKEIGEHKYFNTFLKVRANSPIYFTLDNKSGNSRHTLIDLDYIEGTTSPVIPPDPPSNPGVDTINHNWDVAVEMHWESNNITDMDLHGFMGSTHVCYNNLEENDLYLDYDCVGHSRNNSPEVLSVLGHKNESLIVYIKNYNSGILKEPVIVKIFKHDLLGKELLKLFSINVKANNNLIGVCIINLNTLQIETL